MAKENESLEKRKQRKAKADDDGLVRPWEVSEHGSFWRFGSLKSGRLVERFREGVRRAKRKGNQLPIKRGDGVLLNIALSRFSFSQQWRLEA